MGKTTFKEILGCLPQALLGNFAIGALALVLGIAFGGPKIYIEMETAIYLFCGLLIVYLAVTCWCIFTLAKCQLRENLVTGGPYRLVRHPMYSAIIFILNPALGILFRSWWLIVAMVLIYFFWRQCVKKEEKYLEEKFPQYFEYRRHVWPLFPDLRRINKLAFYFLAGAAFFAVVFTVLNFSAVYLRWVVWEKQGKITYDQPGKKKIPFFSLPTGGALAANYSERADSIVIGQLNIEAPLVLASGTSPNELNSALNQGVVFYPGSALPGQAGEVFLTGHSSVFPWNKTPYGQVFTLLDKLETGDVVSLIYNHRQYDYQITDKEILPPNQVKISDSAEPRLTLFTCWPIGTSFKRLLVKGELIR
ncbi:MAG: putative Isoprenylcysteine carboxyl methyltransferase [Parcubacteria group bacterium LiPW_39]|nr:MAG: putative Isoprenylcysteine carboxyl methyltransferase [Parcubacteria group bacterium LiPW_39]